MLYKQLLRPILFRLRSGDAEGAHERTLAMLALASRAGPLLRAAGGIAAVRSPALERELFGVRFPNPVGLAAGMDKDGVALPAWAALGFGFVEAGTVTWQPQPGNPRPRLFRVPAQSALINRMGFNNGGAAALAARLAAAPALPIPVGISLGKSKAAPIDAAVDDYRASFRALFDHGAYFAINVSSPNTAGLRSLQDRAALDALLGGLQAENRALAAARGRPSRPLLVKLAPDLSDAAIVELLEVCAGHGVAGLIATNTTVGRAGLDSAPQALVAESGGLSGPPLRARALAVVRLLARESGGRLPIVGVGGIRGPEDALAMLDAGAALVQLYTGLIYEGPGLVRRINKALASK